MYNNNDCFKRIEKRSVELWENFITSKCFITRLPLELFWLEMQQERNRIIDALNNRALSKPMMNLMGTANYFIINDLGYGEVCEKCHNSGSVIIYQIATIYQDWKKKYLSPILKHIMHLISNLKVLPLPKTFLFL